MTTIIYKEEDRFFDNIQVLYPDGTRTVEAVDRRDILRRVPYRKVMVHRGMDIVSFAVEQYKKFSENPAQLWWLIAEANGIDNPNEFDMLLEGQEAIVPDYVQFKLLL
jgi:hypothetical protein